MGKSNSSQDYMKTILILHKQKGSVRSVDVAEDMGVTKPSVCNAMKKLRKNKLIFFDEDGFIHFTEEGRAFAEKVSSKHSLLSKLLRLIGVDRDTAEKDACLMEHAISDETYECLDRFIQAQSKA